MQPPPQDQNASLLAVFPDGRCQEVSMPLNATLEDLRRTLGVEAKTPVVSFSIQEDRDLFCRGWLQMREARKTNGAAPGGMSMVVQHPVNGLLVPCWLLYDKPMTADASQPLTQAANYKDVAELFGMLLVRLLANHPRKATLRHRLSLPVLFQDGTGEGHNAAVGWFELAEEGDGHPATAMMMTPV